ncbi:MAG: ATPase [Maritimibacter sp.]|nr:ATPase [Maritimibacter sp.]
MMRILKSREFLVLVLLVAMILAVATVNKAVLRPMTLINIVNSSLFLMLLAIGQMFVILTRGIDVSVGAIAGLSAVIFGFALNAGIPLPLSMVLALATGLVGGMVNGVGVAWVGIPPIIMTLGTLGAYRGLMRVLTGGSWIESIPQNIKSFAVTRYLSVPLMVWAMVVVVIVVAILLWKLKPARYFYAVGDNYDGAYLLGINVKMTRFWAFALSGFFAGAAAIVFVGQIGFVPMQTGNGQELKAIAAVVLGGVSLMGGTGSIWSAVIGALFLTAVDSMMIFLKVPGSWNNAVAGFVLLAVVVFDFLIRRAVRNRRLAARAAEMQNSETEPDGRGSAPALRATPEATS